MATPSKTEPRFFGWRMVGVAFVVEFIAVGFFFYSFGVYFKAIEAELASSRLGVSLGMMVTASGGMGSISEGYSYSGVGAGAGGSEGSEQVNVRGVGEGVGVRILAGGSLGMGAVTARGTRCYIIATKTTTSDNRPRRE